MSTLRIREQIGTDTVRKFDYQMAVAIDYLLTEINSDVIVLIETLEDFAIFRNPGTALEEVEIYQVKTKNAGLYTKNDLYDNNVLGKIILTDIYFDSKSKILNIICNQNLKGSSTELLDKFIFEEAFTKKELESLKTNIIEYLKVNNVSTDKIDGYIGKLVYIKSQLPFSGKEDRYEETLVGKTNSVITDYLNEENHCINPSTIYKTLKILIDKRRRTKIMANQVSENEALELKGIPTSEVRKIIDKANDSINLSKADILQHAVEIFGPLEYEEIKRNYSKYLAYKSNLTDKAYESAHCIIKDEYNKLLSCCNTINELITSVAKNCITLIPYYSPAIIEIISIVVAYSE